MSSNDVPDAHVGLLVFGRCLVASIRYLISLLLIDAGTDLVWDKLSGVEVVVDKTGLG